MSHGVEENHPLAVKRRNVNISERRKKKKKRKERGKFKTDLPDTDNLDEKVTREPRSEHLRHDEHVGSQSRL